MKSLLTQLYVSMDKGPLRVLSLVLSLILAGCIFWDPSRFAAKTSQVEIWQGFLLMWAICAGVVHGVGFRPIKLRWQLFFCPLLADIVLLCALVFILR